VIDDYKREGLAMEVGLSLPASRVIRTLDRLLEYRNAPLSIRCDNGPEFTSHEFQAWAEQKGIRIDYITRCAFRIKKVSYSHIIMI
jgi:putative transposase